MTRSQSAPPLLQVEATQEPLKRRRRSVSERIYVNTQSIYHTKLSPDAVSNREAVPSTPEREPDDQIEEECTPPFLWAPRVIERHGKFLCALSLTFRWWLSWTVPPAACGSLFELTSEVSTAAALAALSIVQLPALVRIVVYARKAGKTPTSCRFGRPIYRLPRFVLDSARLRKLSEFATFMLPLGVVQALQFLAPLAPFVVYYESSVCEWQVLFAFLLGAIFVFEASSKSALFVTLRMIDAMATSYLVYALCPDCPSLYATEVEVASLIIEFVTLTRWMYVALTLNAFEGRSLPWIPLEERNWWVQTIILPFLVAVLAISILTEMVLQGWVMGNCYGLNRVFWTMFFAFCKNGSQYVFYILRFWYHLYKTWKSYPICFAAFSACVVTGTALLMSQAILGIMSAERTISDDMLCDAFTLENSIPLLFPVVQAVYTAFDVIEHAWFILYSLHKTVSPTWRSTQGNLRDTARSGRISNGTEAAIELT